MDMKINQIALSAKKNNTNFDVKINSSNTIFL
jgi:hypothetical protein